MTENVALGLVILGLVVAGVGLCWWWRQRARQAGQALLQATELGDLEAMRTLLARHADLNARNAQGWTPLHLAAAGGDPAVVALLLRHGAVVQAQSNIGTTPLDNAVMRGGRQEVIDLLLAHGAQPSSAWDASL